MTGPARPSHSGWLALPAAASIMAAGAAQAGPVALMPDCQVVQVGQGLSLQGVSMAVDQDEIAYVLEQVGPGIAWFVAAVFPGVPGQIPIATNLSSPSHLAANPRDGSVWFADTVTGSAGSVATFYRLLGGAAVPQFSLPTVVHSLAIDRQGRFFVGGANGMILRIDPGLAPALVPHALGSGNNTRLHALTGGELVILGGLFASTWLLDAAGSLSLLLQSSYTPTTYDLAFDYARNPFPAFGPGVALAIASVTAIPGTLTGTTRLAMYDAQGAFLGDVAMATWGTNDPEPALIAPSFRNAVYWYERPPAATPTQPAGRLFRIEAVPSPGIPGTLLLSAQGGVVQGSLQGSQGGQPFLLGACVGGAGVPLLVPGLGVLDVGPLSPSYVAWAAFLPPSGVLPIAFTTALTGGTMAQVQGAVLSPQAPNGVAWLTNVATLVFP
jgi:hypothetical protein